MNKGAAILALISLLATTAYAADDSVEAAKVWAAPSRPGGRAAHAARLRLPTHPSPLSQTLVSPKVPKPNRLYKYYTAWPVPIPVRKYTKALFTCKVGAAWHAGTGRLGAGRCLACCCASHFPPGRLPAAGADSRSPAARRRRCRAAMRCAPTPPASSSPTASPRWQSAAATTLTMSTWGPGRACCRPAPPRPSRPGEPPSHACPPACRPAAAAPGAGDQGLPSQGRQVPERHQLRPVLQPDERPLHVPVSAGQQAAGGHPQAAGAARRRAPQAHCQWDVYPLAPLPPARWPPSPLTRRRLACSCCLAGATSSSPPTTPMTGRWPPTSLPPTTSPSGAPAAPSPTASPQPAGAAHPASASLPRSVSARRRRQAACGGGVSSREELPGVPPARTPRCAPWHVCLPFSHARPCPPTCRRSPDPCRPAPLQRHLLLPLHRHQAPLPYGFRQQPLRPHIPQGAPVRPHHTHLQRPVMQHRAQSTQPPTHSAGTLAALAHAFRRVL